MPRMQVYRPIRTQHRVQRHVLWALAMLRWLAAVLFTECPLSFRHLRRFEETNLLGLERLVGNLVIARALRLVGRPPRRGRLHYWRHGRDLHRRHFRRSLLGARLRRALRHKDIATQIAQLIAVLRNLDDYAAQLAHRLRHKLRRLWRVMAPIAQAAPLLCAPAPAPALADSS
jgi:hypothetical protein